MPVNYEIIPSFVKDFSIGHHTYHHLEITTSQSLDHRIKKQLTIYYHKRTKIRGT